MGLDMYLGRWHKPQLNKIVLNVEETRRLEDGNFIVLRECPLCFSDMAQKIRVTNQYYDTKKISRNFANGTELTLGGFSSGKIFFNNYEKHINLELDSDMIHKDYLLEREEDAYVVAGDYEVAYWRKANQIREWFATHIDGFEDDYGYYEVTKDLLEDLITDCSYVLSNRNIEISREVMPTSSGFFFGSTEYDDYYYGDLEYTIGKCREIIDSTDWDDEVVTYSESW